MGRARRGASFHILLPDLCKMRFSAAAAACCVLISSESHAWLNQTPYEEYYFSIIILINKTRNLLKEGNQVLFGKERFQQNRLVRPLLLFCRVLLVVKDSVRWPARPWAGITGRPTRPPCAAACCAVKPLRSSGLINPPNISGSF